MAVLPRQQAPYFEAEAVKGFGFETVTLSDYKGKWLVLFFYPFDFTFVCPTEVSDALRCSACDGKRWEGRVCPLSSFRSVFSLDAVD